ncbi:ER-derived vesicles protein 41 [Neolecta irregularis DAH-3]|uniref:Endoplasmic reticulum-Golgi intermediate compartment protein n=1 Tax=Neolecta irregularis (strain DAH-3) TaxID=1198029 RepID=A0A1U7LKI2_NEOID|nr:ER-derived vesicles protein 41 [Neolecta irregularis DAH-3]|eukprot:OLL23031.1 ER-derived vesicles protein 41 [Neolecta irregularis DAH-3]
MDDLVPSTIRTFDAFPKVDSAYTTRTSRNVSEFNRYLGGQETHRFSVEKKIEQRMRLNVDITVAMECEVLHINVQDATGDLIVTDGILKKSPSEFNTLDTESLLSHRADDPSLKAALNARKGGLKKRVKTGDACRIWGSLFLNRVMGDFHITAIGHGYGGLMHLDHDRMNSASVLMLIKGMNFSHVIREYSFGDLYPNLVNPLDGIYTRTEESGLLSFPILPLYNSNYVPRSSQPLKSGIPGIFFKYDIEPLSLTVTANRISFFPFLIRLTSIIGGLLVCTEWVVRFLEMCSMRMLARSSNSLGILDKPEKNEEW